MLTYEPEELLRTLQERFKLPNFRHGQKEAIQLLLDYGSVLCIHPTGFGKSLLYQLPATLLPGLTLVISPLLALMRDQEKQLNERFGIPAAAINSDQSPEENSYVQSLLGSNKLKILFVAPEQLEHIDRFEHLLSLPVSLVVVDEAHCISTWGHDFRPSYRQIAHFVQAAQAKNPSIRVLGLTATANGRTEGDISTQLSIPVRPVKVLRSALHRRNIALDVLPVKSAGSKLAACAQLLHALEGSGLIYCSTRESAELVSDYLKKAGINAEGYHAGFSSEQKRTLQEGFLADKYKVLAATNALGMGIDKSNLRFIIHYELPGSITAYYQEVGRCGRDGLSANAILLYDPADKRVQHYFIESAVPQTDDFKIVLTAISSSQELLNAARIKCLTGLHPTRVTVILSELVEQGFIRKSSIGGLMVYQLSHWNHEPNLERYQIQHQVKNRELQQLVDYAEQGVECRMALLQKALGDSNITPCGICSVCNKNASSMYVYDDVQAEKAKSWLSSLIVPIEESKAQSISAGFALLDGKARSDAFVHFMRNRALLAEGNLTAELWKFLQKQLDMLRARERLSCIVVIPSRTWLGRAAIATAIGNYTGVPVFLDLLAWKSTPENRQGELMNNDQRKQNVHMRMTAPNLHPFPIGTILLLDDYTGSGCTLKEAARALRKEAKTPLPILPITLAAVKWRLGRSGMI